MPYATRAEHIEWCKARALEYADAGDPSNAIASLGSDLGKHPETRDHVAITMGSMELFAGRLSAPGAARRFIERVS